LWRIKKTGEFGQFRKIIMTKGEKFLQELGVYLRMLDIPVPVAYGLSADDDQVLLIQPFQYS